MNRILKLTTIKNKELEKYFDQAMSELRELFGINWVYNTPALIIIDDRKTLDNFKGQETEDWQIGFCMGRKAVVIINPENIEKESIHKYSDEDVYRLIKHELCHCFYHVATSKSSPKWLTEGLSIYASGQIDKKKHIEKFTDFLESKKNYFEWGHSVRVLIEKYGIERVIEFVKSLKGTRDDEFEKIFEDFFDIKLSYNTFNKLLENS
jgi:hypothetical protein